MTVKGYYPSASLGFEILLGCINILAGVALLAFSLVLLFNQMFQLMGLAVLAALVLPVAIMTIAAGSLAFSGSCRESVTSVKAAYILSILTLLAVGGIMAYTFATASGLNDAGRKVWYSLSDENKQVVEVHYACCGFADLNEATAGCQPTTTCADPIIADVGGKLKVLVILGAVVGGVQVGAILCGCCLWGKMKSQQEKKMRKAKLTLAEEAQGGYKNRSHHGTKHSKGAHPPKSNKK